MKKIISLLLVFILGMALIGCDNKDKSDSSATKSDVKSKASEKKTYRDKDFINDVFASINDSELDKDYSDIDFDNLSQEEKDKIIKEQEIMFIQEKLDRIEKYKDLDFESSDLKNLAEKYIDVLNTQKELISDDKDKKILQNGTKLRDSTSYAWLECEECECEIILELANNYGLKMDDRKKKDLEDIKAEIEQDIQNYVGKDKEEDYAMQY